MLCQLIANTSYYECWNPVLNTTQALEDPVVCIQDPLGLYLLLSVVDLFAYLVPCAFREDYPIFRTVLFSLNLALVANIAFDVYVDPMWGISVITVLVLVALGVLFYSLFKTFALLAALLFAIGAGMWTLQPFSQAWLEHFLGVDYVSINVVNSFLAAISLLTVGVFYLASSLKFFGWIVDSVVYSTLAVFSVQFLKFFFLENWSRSDWQGAQFFPDPTQLCCDDVHVACPIWFTMGSLLLFFGLFTVRMTISAQMMDEPPVKPGKEESKPLVRRMHPSSNRHTSEQV